MLRQVLMNLTKNAVEASSSRMVVAMIDENAHQMPSRKGLEQRKASYWGGGRGLSLYIGNDGLPIPAEDRQSLFVPFFTTKRSGSGIGLSLSRRMMLQQGGMLELAEKQQAGCRVGFILTIALP